MRRLVIRRETVRMLAELDLIRVAGGNPDAPLMDTEGSPAETCVHAPAAVPAKP
jgi:hypothetical protein